MLYKLSHSVAANTTSDNPDWQKLKITHGVIRQWIVFMPVEAANLLKVQIRRGNHQILPMNENQWLYGGGYFFTIGEDLPIFEAPYELDIFAYNDDDTQPHEYNVHVNILPEEAFIGRVTLPGLMDKIRAFFGGI